MAVQSYSISLAFLHLVCVFGIIMKPPSWPEYYTYSVDSKSMNDVPAMTMTVNIGPTNASIVFHNGTHHDIYNSFYNTFRIFVENKAALKTPRIIWALQHVVDGSVRELCWDQNISGMVDEYAEEFPKLPNLSLYNYEGVEELRQEKLEKWTLLRDNDWGLSRERTIWLKFGQRDRKKPIPVYMQDRFITANMYVYGYMFHDFFGFTENKSFKGNGGPQAKLENCSETSGGSSPKRVVDVAAAEVSREGTKEIPENFDWRLRGAVSPVRFLRDCGDWAYAVVGAMEGAYFVQKKKPLPMFSEQFLIDCSWDTGNLGCVNGESLYAFDYINKAGGIPTVYDYGALLATDAFCTLGDTTNLYAPILKIVKAPADETLFKAALMKYGPITIKLAMTLEEVQEFRRYTHGVFNTKLNRTKSSKVNAHVLVVGFGDLDGHSYWLVKGCYGPWWGLEGYMLLSTEWDPEYVLNNAYYPILK